MFSVGRVQPSQLPIPYAEADSIKRNRRLVRAHHKGLSAKALAASCLRAKILSGRVQPLKSHATDAQSSVVLPSSLLAKPVVVVQFLSPAQIENDAHLMLIWPRMVDALGIAGVAILKKDMPKTAGEVRDWFKAHPKELELIRDLNLTHLDLRMIPKEFTELSLPRLFKLALDSNKLSELPENFGKFWPKMRFFSISSNDLKVIRDGFGDEWRELTMLYLQNNKLAAFPVTFGRNWSELDTFYLSNNQMQSFTCDLSAHWKKLDVLYLYENQVKTLPPSFGSHWNWWRKKREDVLYGNPILLTHEWRVVKLEERAHECPEVRELRKNADKLGAWKVKFEKTYSKFQAETNWITRTIVLSPDLSEDEGLSFYIFELTNAVKEKKFNKLHKLTREGKITREEFAKRNERHEHFGALRHRKIVTAAIRSLKWNEAVNIYTSRNEDFEKDWVWIQRGAHAEYYRKAWDKIPKLATA